MSLSRSDYQRHASIGVYPCPCCSVSRSTHPELHEDVLVFASFHLGRHSAKAGRVLVCMSSGCVHAMDLMLAQDTPFPSVEAAESAWRSFCESWIERNESTGV